MPPSILPDCLNGILTKMACSVSAITISEDGDATVVSIESPAGDYLIGQNGETLSSLTRLFRKIIEKKAPDMVHRSILIDVNGYRKRRAETLQGIAKMLAERARTFRHDVEMDPFPPYDRLVIHSFFENPPWITSESHGEGRHRHVVLKYVEREVKTPAEF